MNDKAEKLGPHSPRTGLRSFLRTAGTGAVAVVIAVGVLFMATASVPAARTPGNDGDLPMRLNGLIESVSVGETDTAPDGVTLVQIVAVLERAEQRAREEGPNFSPTIAQAAAELGMLYTTYQMQQLAFGENNEGLRPDDAPAASGSGSGSEEDADAPASGPEKDAGSRGRDGAATGADTKDGADRNSGAKDADDAPAGDSADDKDDVDRPQPEEDTPPAVEVSNESTSVIDSHDEDPQAGYVTYDQVVIAAVRLANLLDPSVPNALVEVNGVEQGAGRSGVSLRENLLDVVSMFGGTTTGYANGRIPADVLCPLSFAPGHMLRCDAAERLTALSAEFEAEFGYPIPITDSYRSYAAQVVLAGVKPLLAATPGTSNHGWGIAVDLGNPIAGGSSPQYVWLRVHGPDYGWDNPSWARLGGAKPEPWHFEFFAAGSIPNRAIDPSDVGTWSPSDSEPPRYKPALDPKPRDESSGSVRKPGTKPSDDPSDNPPSQKPPEPTPKPSDPGDDPTDEPSRPTPPTGGTPSTPPPSEDPSDEPSEEPSDEPSEEPSGDPSEQPSDEPSEEPSPAPDPSEEPSDECAATEPETDESPAPSPDAPDDATAGSTATDDGTASGSEEDPCTVPDEVPEGEADASSSGLLAVLPKSTNVVTASRRPRPRGLS